MDLLVITYSWLCTFILGHCWLVGVWCCVLLPTVDPASELTDVVDWIYISRERERQTETEREGGRERQTDRQRQTGRDRDRQTGIDRLAETDTDRQTDRDRDRDSETPPPTHTHTHRSEHLRADLVLSPVRKLWSCSPHPSTTSRCGRIKHVSHLGHGVTLPP